MTPEEEDFALRSCHPLYAEWCRDDGEDEQNEEE